MIAVLVFLLILNQMLLHLVQKFIEPNSKIYLILNQMVLHFVQNRKENYRHDHIPFNLERDGNIFSECQL